MDVGEAVWSEWHLRASLWMSEHLLFLLEVSRDRIVVEGCADKWR